MTVARGQQRRHVLLALDRAFVDERGAGKVKAERICVNMSAAMVVSRRSTGSAECRHRAPAEWRHAVTHDHLDRAGNRQHPPVSLTRRICSFVPLVKWI